MNGSSVDPRAIARQRVGDRYDVRVLEPSPPAVDAAPWFADDPVSASVESSDRPVVGPVACEGTDITWSDLIVQEPELADWCADRWLAGWRRLPALPSIAVYTATRDALHALAIDVVSPARAAVNGKIGLRSTYRGFGTPYFGDDEQVRVEGTELVVIRSGTVTRSPLADRVDDASAAFLADWYGFAASVLEQLRGHAHDDHHTTSRVQLWPEHFDLSVTIGESASQGTFGASPGDDVHSEPYLYVSPAGDPPPDQFWNDATFMGASLPLATLVAADDQRAAALEFFGRARQLLTRPPT